METGGFDGRLAYAPLLAWTAIAGLPQGDKLTLIINKHDHKMQNKEMLLEVIDQELTLTF